MEKDLPPTPPLLSWQAPLRPKHARGTIWYSVAGILTILAILYSLNTGAWDFLIIILMTAGLYWKLHRTEPTVKEINIWAEGFQLDDEFIPWDFCRGWWFLKAPDFTQLRIEHDSRVKGDLMIQTGAVSQHTIRTLLTEFIPELGDRKESAIDAFGRVCKI